MGRVSVCSCPAQSMGLGWKDCWHCFILLIQVDQAHDLIVLEAACTRGDVIPVQVALKACMGGLRTLDCLSRLMTVLPLHSKSKILEVQRTVEWILADDKPCQASTCLLSPYLAKAGISAISGPVLFLQSSILYNWVRRIFYSSKHHVSVLNYK